jgi:hypothetical protein
MFQKHFVIQYIKRDFFLILKMGFIVSQGVNLIF